MLSALFANARHFSEKYLEFDIHCSLPMSKNGNVGLNFYLIFVSKLSTISSQTLDN